MRHSSATCVGFGWRRWVALALAVTTLAGCGTKRPAKVFPPAASRDAIQRARDLLDLYASGQPPGSEVEGFPTVVADVRAVDAAVAATLEAGLAEITAQPASAQATASRLLDDLPVSAAAAAAAAGLGPAR
ncbi:MAG: hypothetical protein ACKOCX_08795 [Planctomycetota bacterium]